MAGASFGSRRLATAWALIAQTVTFFAPGGSAVPKWDTWLRPAGLPRHHICLADDNHPPAPSPNGPSNSFPNLGLEQKAPTMCVRMCEAISTVFRVIPRRYPQRYPQPCAPDHTTVSKPYASFSEVRGEPVMSCMSLDIEWLKANTSSASALVAPDRNKNQPIRSNTSLWKVSQRAEFVFHVKQCCCGGK